MPNTHFSWARSEDFSPFREHRLIRQEAGPKIEAQVKAKDGSDVPPGPEQFEKMVDARRKSADANVKGASDGVRTTTERAGKELNNFFDDLNRPVTLSEEAQKSAGNILRSYDAQTNYSREETTARLQVLGFQFTTDGPDNEFDRAVQNAKAEPPGTVVPPLRAGSTISKISGAFGLFNTMLQRHVRDRGGSQSERGKFVTGVEDFNRSNRNTASLMINQRAAAGTTPASEDLSVTLLQTGAVTAKEMQERRQNFTKQLRTSNLVNETDMKARENDSNIFVIKDITPAKFRQVQNAINAIRDSRDVAASTPSSGPSGGPSGGPSSGPALPEGQKVRNEGQELITGLQARLNRLPVTNPTRIAITEKIALLQGAIQNQGNAPDVITKHISELRKMEEELNKALGQADKTAKDNQERLGKSEKAAEAEVKSAEETMKLLSEPRLQRVRNIMQQRIDTLNKARADQIPTSIDVAIAALNETTTRVNRLLPVLVQSEEAVKRANDVIADPTVPDAMKKTVQSSLQNLEKGRSDESATADSVGALVKILNEQTQKEVIDKSTKSASEIKELRANGQTAMERGEKLQKGGGALPAHVNKALEDRLISLRRLIAPENTSITRETLQPAIKSLTEVTSAIESNIETAHEQGTKAMSGAQTRTERGDANDPVAAGDAKRVASKITELSAALNGLDPALINSKINELADAKATLETACKRVRKNWGHDYLLAPTAVGGTHESSSADGNQKYSKSLGVWGSRFLGAEWNEAAGTWGVGWWNGGRGPLNNDPSAFNFGDVQYDLIASRLKDINTSATKPSTTSR